MLGSKNTGDHAAGVTWETAVAPEFLYMRGLVVVLERGLGGHVLSLPLNSMHFVSIEFVCLFGLVYQVD